MPISRGHVLFCRLGLDRIGSASQLCTLVFKCDLPLLRRYLAAGIDVNAGDYDDRTALHIAACESNLAVVGILHSYACVRPKFDPGRESDSIHIVCHVCLWTFLQQFVVEYL